MNISGSKSVYDASIAYAFFKTLTVPSLRPTSLRAIASIFRNFFLRQYRAALLPGQVPVTAVDHPLDRKIPFMPAWVTIYLDFAAFWIRVLSFLLREYRRRAFAPVREFIASMGELYAFAAEVYQKNFSTTKRPFYIARPRFFLIHLVDPHLMCIPSLHVMVAIRTWTKLAAILRSLGDAERLAPQIEEMKQGALAITAAVVFVKQHSVNCIAAALYAMTCFDGELFPPEEAAAFTDLLFADPWKGPVPKTASAPAAARAIYANAEDGPQSAVIKMYIRPPANARVRPQAAPRTRLPPADTAEIKAHIIGLYRRFLSGRETAKTWDEPLLEFLRAPPERQ